MGDETPPQASMADDVGELTPADGDADEPAAPEAPPSPYADDVDALADSAASGAPPAGEEA
jgi:hypothetical protein